MKDLLKFLLLVLIFFPVTTPFVLGGTYDVWAECSETSKCDKITVDTTDYWCVFYAGSWQWRSDTTTFQACPYAGYNYIRDYCSAVATVSDDDNICGDPGWSNGQCTGDATCALKNEATWINVDTTTDTCEHCNDCSYTNVDCDAYDDIDGSDGTLTESEVTSTSCTIGCSASGCCDVQSKTCSATYECQRFYDLITNEDETPNDICYINNTGSWVWASSAETSETACDDGYDNDCDGYVDSADSDCVCREQGEACLAVTDCCSNYTFDTTCYYNPACLNNACSFMTCSLDDYCGGTDRCGDSTGDTIYYDGQCTADGCSFSSADCACDATETDEGQNFTTPGNCTDYVGCSGTACQSMKYTDYCINSTTLREYYVSGTGDDAVCSYVDKNCGDLGESYSCVNGTDGGACVAVCIRADPSVAIDPSSQIGQAGDTLSYTVSVTNNDNDICGPSDFSLEITLCPSGWACSLSTNSLTIAPGSTGTATLSVTSPSDAESGNYQIVVNATNTNSGYSGTGSTIYVVTCGACPLDTPYCFRRICEELSEEAWVYHGGSNGHCCEIDGTYYSCLPQDDIGCCPQDSMCVYDGECYDSGTYQDVDLDEVKEYCRGGSSGIWIEPYYNFTAWLGAKALNLKVGESFKLNIYFKNKGNLPDYYHIKDIRIFSMDSEGNDFSHLISVKSSINTTDLVNPDDVATLTPEITIYGLLPPQSRIEFDVNATSELSFQLGIDPPSTRTLTLYLASGIPESLPEFSNYLIPILIVSIVIMITVRF